MQFTALSGLFSVWRINSLDYDPTLAKCFLLWLFSAQLNGHITDYCTFLVCVLSVTILNSIILIDNVFLTGLRRENPNNMAWNTALSGSEALASGADLLTEADIKKTRSSWPITLFLAIIISAPYFIWRIISSLDSPASNGQGNINRIYSINYVKLLYISFYYRQKMG